MVQFESKGNIEIMRKNFNYFNDRMESTIYKAFISI